jgi:glutamyl-tRNA reductase
MSASIGAILPRAFFLDSCQRCVWVCSREELARSRSNALDGSELPSSVAIFAGVEAYVFLLRVATGLESQILGETDIFGQFKEAWRKHSADESEARAELGVLMQRIFEDTKDIRSRYLQNLGGASYGSLVRMILRGRPNPKEPTLIVGAGQLAQSVAPYFADGELWLSNRNQANLIALYAEIKAKNPGAKVRMIQPEEEARAWSEAANVVVCVPFDEARDPERIALRRARGNDGVVIHLGGQRAQSGEWSTVGEFHALDDLFALERAQGNVRMTQISQAARACEEKAKLRSLGASITLPHGWEDLAVFA